MITKTSCNASLRSSSRGMMLMMLVASSMLLGSILAAEGGTRNAGRDLADCESQCKDPKFKDLEYFKGDEVLKMDVMLKRFKQSRKAVRAKMIKDYGEETYLKIFEPLNDIFDVKTNKTTNDRISVGRERIFNEVPNLFNVPKDPEAPLPPYIKGKPSLAWTRLMRKMQIKLLQVRLGILEERDNVKAICLDECAAADEGQTRRALGSKASGGLYNKFTWTTGGHSASAGHGDLHREAYTAMMGEDLKPVFAAIGVDFKAKNYAMGGTDSGEEVALCVNSIFGRDVDFISWDYGMTDGHDLWKMILYAYKAAGISKIHQSRSQPGNLKYHPAFFAIHHNPVHNLAIEEMGKLGLTALAWHGLYMKRTIEAALPDMMGKSDGEIAAMPKYVQYFKCQGKIEAGDPGCGDKKFSQEQCWPRRFATSWHPGWRYHGLVGHLMAVTLMDAAEDAMEDLINLEKEAGVPDNESPADMKKRFNDKLGDLNRLQEKDYENIFSSPIPDPLIPHLERFWAGEPLEHLKDLDIETFLKEPSFCHTPLMPSEIRYQGYLTENFTYTGDVWNQQYEDGFDPQDIELVENPNKNSGKEPAAFVDPRSGKEDQFLLVKDASSRQECPVYLNVDYKDYFHLSSVEGWRTMTIPNESERKAFTEFDGKKSKGLVVMCNKRCFWGKCKEGDLQEFAGWRRPKPRKGETLINDNQVKQKWGKLEMTVNGEPVTEFSNMHTCLALKNKNGHYFKPNKDGKYEIRARINPGEEYSYMDFSSIIVI